MEKNILRKINLSMFLSLVALWFGSFGQAAGSAIKMFNLKDGPQLTQYLEGEVLLLGKDFPGKYFQRAILEKLKNRQIKVRVVTGERDRKSLSSIQKAGGLIRVLPTGVTGGLVITKNAVLVPGIGSWRVVTGIEVTAPVKNQFEETWQLTERLRR